MGQQYVIGFRVPKGKQTYWRSFASRWWLGVFLLLFSSAQTPARLTMPLILQPETLPFTPQEFYIADVVEERKDRKTIGNLLVTNAGVNQIAEFERGTEAAIKQFIRQSMPTNTRLRPLLVHIKAFNITENPVPGGRADGVIKVKLGFSYLREGKRVALVDYEGGGRYNRLVTQTNVVEPMLRKALVNGLGFINTWVNREANHNEKLATRVNISFSDFGNKNEPDTVFYADRRLLTWDDFHGKPRPGPNAAVVFPGFAYVASRRVVKGVVQVQLDIKVYMVKIASWVTEPVREPYGLNHEQRHFDIVKMAAERFKQNVKAARLSVADYDNTLAIHYFRTRQEIQDLQEQYDHETRHSQNTQEQARWNRYIDEQLATLLVKK